MPLRICFYAPKNNEKKKRKTAQKYTNKFPNGLLMNITLVLLDWL